VNDVENPLLATACVGLGAERDRDGERSVAVTLGQLAREQRAPVLAVYVGDVLLEEVLLDGVGEHVEKALRVARQMFGELGDAFLAHAESGLLAQIVFPRQIGGNPLRGEVDQTLARHGSIP